jgi:hypothetical protein
VRDAIEQNFAAEKPVWFAWGNEERMRAAFHCCCHGYEPARLLDEGSPDCEIKQEGRLLTFRCTRCGSTFTTQAPSARPMGD